MSISGDERDGRPLAPDYDGRPERWRALDRSALLRGDVHGPVAARLAAAGLAPVLDVGGGEGELGRHLPPGWPVVVVDPSPAMLAAAPHPKVRAPAETLPVASGAAGAVAMLWMLYHLADPVVAIAEAWRVLRPGGMFVASASARDNDPELTDGYPPTTFDAEDAGEIVGRVFGEVAVEPWDEPAVLLADRAAVERYCVHHLLPRRRPTG